MQKIGPQFPPTKNQLFQTLMPCVLKKMMTHKIFTDHTGWFFPSNF